MMVMIMILWFLVFFWSLSFGEPDFCSVGFYWIGIGQYYVMSFFFEGLLFGGISFGFLLAYTYGARSTPYMFLSDLGIPLLS